MLTTRFDKSFDKFYAKLNNIVNSNFNHGEQILDIKIVKEVIRFLSERFKPKARAIEESKDLDLVKIREFVGSLQTYELNLPQSKKNNSLVLNIVK